MNFSYPVIYSDKFGVESTAIVNDGDILKLTLRGVEFSGHNFHSFRISPLVDNSRIISFNLFDDLLCGYSVDCQIPVWLVNNDGELQSILHVHVERGEPVAGHTTFVLPNGTESVVDGKIDNEILRLEIEYQGKAYKSAGKNQYNSFDEQFTELRNAIPADIYWKTCWNCAFSDYHPAGSGVFGDLACFRNLKKEYGQVKDKKALMQLWNRRADSVQEIYLCSEFEKRQPGVGGFYVG